MPSLIIDYKIDRLIKEIQKDSKDKNGKELTYETIVEVLESQLKATINGMATGDTIVWKFLGSFVATKRRVDALNKRYERRGKTPTLKDTGLVRMSFKRTGEIKGTTDLSDSRERDILEVPDKYKTE